MRIKGIRLKNVKSYVDETIRFNDGVNFICGANGSGKTTIVESIGYALFGCPPDYGFKRFIRHGQSRGEIHLWIEANDEREYRIVRKFTSKGGTMWSIFDQETGEEVETGEADVKEWLRENLGIGVELDLEELFRTVIGVGQGAFVAPFLERPKKRESYFNSIFNLESYREAFERTREAERELKTEIALLEERMKALKERAEGYEEKEAELERISSELGQVRGEIEAISSKLDEKRRQLDIQRTLRDEIADRWQSIAKLEKRIERARAEMEGIKEKIAEAERAREIVRSHEPQYREFLRLEEELKGLEAERRRRESIRLKLQGLEGRMAALKAEIEASLRSASEQKERLMGEEEGLREGISRIEASLSSLRGSLGKLEGELRPLEELIREVGRIEIQAAELEGLAGELEMIDARMAELRSEMEELEGRLARRAELAERVRELERAERDLERLRAELAGIEERLDIARRNAELAEGGICPLLKVVCPVVGERLEEIFKREIDRLSRERESKRRRIAELEGKLEELTALRKHLIKLEGDEKRLGDVKEEIERLERRRQERVESADIAGFLSSIARIADLLSSIDMGEVAERLRSLIPAGKSIRLKALVEKAEAVVREARREVEGRAESIRNGIESLKRRISGLEAAKLERLSRLQIIGSQLQKLEAGIERERRRIEAEIAELAAERAKTADELKAFEELEERMERLLEMRERLKPIYDEYIRNEGIAAQLEERRATLARKSLELAELEEEMRRASLRLRELEARFDRELLERLEDEVNVLSAELAALREKERRLEADLRRAEAELREMRKAMEEMGRAEARRRAAEEALKLLNFLRTEILNKAGDRIADRYRRAVAQEATRIYREISGEPVTLSWEEGYEVVLVDRTEGGERRRVFRQLSGGEQVSAALAVRLALLEFLSDVGIGIFDEPTVNLDEDRRLNLAKVIPTAVGDFSQLFIISHDDSFDSITENVIRLEKDERLGSRVINF